jgi:glutamine phosphoribosylpyrophosphate amidotransferase
MSDTSFSEITRPRPVPPYLRVVEESTIRGLHYLGKAEHLNGKVIVYHTRYCTSGKDHQPIFRDKEALVMNGVVHMGTKKEMEKHFNIKMETDNDAEVLLQYLDSYSFEELCVMWPNASMAGILLTPKKLIAFRNDKRPLWVIEKGKSVLLASTLDILKRAGADTKGAKLLTSEKTYGWTI